MAGRYSRNYSNYILRRKHQDINTGTIWERDWVTIGAQHQIEKGKRPFFGDSGFLYTINNIPSTKKRHDYGKWIASWLYDDVKDATSIVNSVEVNNISNDIRDFAYYGSCYELISASILDIIKWYPAVMWSLPPAMDTSATITFPLTSETDTKYINQNNCCDVLTKEQYDELTDEDEKAKYYKLRVTPVGGKYKATGYRLHNPFNVDLTHVDMGDGKDLNPHRFFGVTYQDFDITLHTWGNDNANMNGHMLRVDEFEVIPTDVYLNNIGCPDNYQFHQIVTVKLTEYLEDRRVEVKLYGYQVYDEVLFTSGDLRVIPDSGAVIDYTIHWYIDIRLKQEFVDKFYANLEPFEKLLLRTDTKPLYKNTFLTPYETDTGYYYTHVDYVWPSKDGVIDISSPVYYDFINKLSYLGETLDELWCDNLWRNMTHESIKNYDWTYTKEFSDGDEAGNIAGGLRVEQLIRVYGRLFDDLKRYVDGIKLTNRASYDFYNNMPYAELSDKLDLMGWDVVSTIPFFYDDNDELVDVTDVSIGESYKDFVLVEDENKNWSKPLNDDGSQSQIIDETTYNGLSDADKEKCTKLFPENRWFYGVNSNDLTPPVIDNMFMRDLMMSSKHILRSKGTIKSIEMVMALFGFGYGDFKTYERYYHLQPMIYSEDEARKIGELNNRENGAWDEPSYYNGIPVGNVEMYNCRYIVPFYSNKKYYDGEFTFESKGGWGADTEDLQTAEFKETLSYLRVAGNIGDLLSINPYSVKENDIYYVIDLSDIVQYDENADLTQTTHFFICVNDVFTEKYSSWKNIKETDDEYATALYLYNIISTDVGNNPHVGYGKYDFGQEYRDYMTHPFKYAMDNYKLDEELFYDMEDVEFNLAISDDMPKKENKILDCISNGLIRGSYIANLLRIKACLSDIYDNHLFDINPEMLDNCLTSNDISTPARADMKHVHDRIASGEVIELSELRQYVWTWIANIDSILRYSMRYHLNSKYFVIENKIDNQLYKEYFMAVIAPYIMQVIPSTTILIFKDFN